MQLDGRKSAAKAPDPVPLLESEARTFLADAIGNAFSGRIALVSSFGSESVVLLHLVASIDPTIPVLFTDTEMLFEETQHYREDLTALLGLEDVRVIRPDPGLIAAEDPDGTLHNRDLDHCCHLRKVLPLRAALEPFDAWITGRKRFQSSTRKQMATHEHDEMGRAKLNPLAAWTPDHLSAYMVAYGLPPHPLVAEGYVSIGCEPCTSPVREGEDNRAGRWRGTDKSECGIHVVDGRIVRVGPPD